MRILIGGGGTGGHIYPGLALARYAMMQDGGAEVLFVGSEAGLENKIVPAAGFDLVTIPARGLTRSPGQLFSFFRDLLKGIGGAKKIIEDFKPQVVLGTGGYVSAPLTIASLIKRVPVVIHEQNALPGKVNRLMAPLAKRVCISFPQTAKRMPPFSHTIFTGNPRAGEVASLSREEGCRLLSLDPGLEYILVYGGSRGALKINEVVAAYLQEGLLPEKMGMIYVTGEIYYEKVIADLGEQPGRVRVYPYLDEMPAALAAASLALTRSGATTLAEITGAGVPAILIPSPNVVQNHQYFNARILSDAGAAVLINEHQFSPSRLKEEVDRLNNEPGLLAGMADAGRAIGVRDAAARLYSCLREVS